MESGDYIIIWIVYLIAASIMTWIAWRVYRKYLWREIAYFFLCTTLAIFFTPWYVLPEREVLAPAIIVFLMDSITIGPVEGIRALIPLVMTIFLGFIAAVVLSIVYRIRKRGHP